MQKNRYKDMEYLTFPLFSGTDMVDHLFTTRLGGVSKGCLGTMNLSYARGDRKENVDENYRRVAKAMGRSLEEFVMTDQTHTVNVRTVHRQDAGKGILSEKDYRDVDGFVTDCRELVLGALFADCVPLYFLDPVRRAIGLAHAGWRGSADGMASVMVRRMARDFGSRPEDIIAGIGPCICRDCYEVGEDVTLRFRDIFQGLSVNGRTGRELAEDVCRQNKDGKYQLDLRKVNYYILLSEGVKAEHISVADICTCCNGDYLFSHRASSGHRGNLGAFLALK